jgi:hypothetical protein
MHLFDLPESVLGEMYSSWLYVIDLVRLDSALCNWQVRFQILALLSAPESIMRCTLGEQKYLQREKKLLPMLKWAISKKFRLDGILLTCTSAAELARNFLCGDHLEWIHLEQAYFADTALYNGVLAACPNLRSLNAHSMVEVWLPSSRPKLIHLELPSSTRSVDNDRFLALCKPII